MPVKELGLQVPGTCRPGARDREKYELTESVEEYTEGIYRLQKELAVVGTGDIARYMRVAPASVTAMLKRLAEMRLVEHVPYHGVRLTPKGLDLSLSVLRKHRLVERLLVDFLELPWETVHGLACKLEHYISEDVADRISKALGQPSTCPHGNPIALTAADGSRRLSECTVGDALEVSRITDERQEFLAYILDIGLVPKARFVLKNRTPFGDVLTLELECRSEPIALGRDVAESIWVSSPS